MKISKFTFMTLSLLTVSLLPLSASAIVIDQFNSTETFTTNSTTLDAAVLGGEREISIFNPGSIPDAIVTLNGSTATVSVAGPSFPSSAFGNVSFNYDGIDGNPNAFDFGLPPLDLSSTLGLQFDITELNISSQARFQAQAFTQSGSAFSIVQDITAVGTVFNPWSSFPTVGSPDLSIITGLQLNIILGIGDSITIDNFEIVESNTAVPEPTTALLLGASLLAGRFRKKLN